MKINLHRLMFFTLATITCTLTKPINDHQSHDKITIDQKFIKKDYQDYLQIQVKGLKFGEKRSTTLLPDKVSIADSDNNNQCLKHIIVSLRPFYAATNFLHIQAERHCSYQDSTTNITKKVENNEKIGDAKIIDGEADLSKTKIDTDAASSGVIIRIPIQNLKETY